MTDRVTDRKLKNVSIVLAAGSGKRMGTGVKKQYLELKGKPLMAHCLDIMQRSDIITDVIVVCGSEDEEYCREEIVGRFGYDKVIAVTPGGKERYHSVMAGLDKIEEIAGRDGCEYVFIHDAARPFITEETLVKLYDSVRECEACVAAVKSKDTVKIANSADYVVSTPNRELTWIIQTPQVFTYSLAKEAYDRLKEEECGLPCQGIVVTDDAMVVETWTSHRVKLVESSYENIKVTTPEDMDIAEAIIRRRGSVR